MRILAWTAILLTALASAAWADDDRYILRDKDGRRTGTVEKGVGDRYVIRDKDGRRTGTIEPGVGGRQVVRDKDGRRVGTIDRK